MDTINKFFQRLNANCYACQHRLDQHTEDEDTIDTGTGDGANRLKCTSCVNGICNIGRGSS